MLIVYAFGIMVANGGFAVAEYPTKALCEQHRKEVASAPISVSECFERESSADWRVSPNPGSIGWSDKIAEERRWAKLHPDWAAAAKYDGQH